MATAVHTKKSVASSYGTAPEEEEGWSGVKLTLLGVATLGIALTILYFISP